MSGAPFSSSNHVPVKVSLTEDQRMELAAAAQRDERAGRPVWAVVVGGLALLGSVVAVAVAQYQSGGAYAEYINERNQTTEIRKVIEGIRAVEAATAGPEARARFEANPRVVSQLVEKSTAAGLSGIEVNEVEPSPVANSDLVRKRYNARFTGQPADGLFRWLKATTEITGLELSQISIQPDGGTPEGEPRWKGTISFTRYERK